MHLRKAVEWFLEAPPGLRLAGPLKMATDAAVGHVLHPRATTEPYCRFPPLILCLSTHVDHVPPEDQNENPPRQLSSTVGLSEPTPVNERPLSDDYPGSDDISPAHVATSFYATPVSRVRAETCNTRIHGLNHPLLSPPLLAFNVSHPTLTAPSPRHRCHVPIRSSHET